MTTFDQMASKIIKEQELIIGPIAWTEAGKVQGLHITPTHDIVSIDNGDGGKVINNLVGQYEHLFGRASREVCIEAVASMIAGLPSSEIPSSLIA